MTRTRSRPFVAKPAFIADQALSFAAGGAEQSGTGEGGQLDTEAPYRTDKRSRCRAG